MAFYWNFISGIALGIQHIDMRYEPDVPEEFRKQSITLDLFIISFTLEY